MGMLKLDAVVHWSIPVNNLEESEKFYGEILGLEHVGRLANSPMSCFKLGNHNIILCKRKEPLVGPSSKMAVCIMPSMSAPKCLPKPVNFSTSLASRFMSRWITVPADFLLAGSFSCSIPAAIESNCAIRVGSRACRRRRMRKLSDRETCPCA